MCPTTTDDHRATTTSAGAVAVTDDHRATAAPDGPATAAHTGVDALSQMAGALSVDDDRWEALRPVIRDAIDALIEGGVLPRHLALSPSDPPAVVSRTLAVVARRLGAGS